MLIKSAWILAWPVIWRTGWASCPLFSMRRVPEPTNPSGAAPRASWNRRTASNTALSIQLLVGAGLGRNLEPLPEQHHLLVDHAVFEHGSVGDRHHVGLGCDRLGRLAAAARLEQLLAQRFELRLIGLEAPEIGGGVGADGDRSQHL